MKTKSARRFLLILSLFFSCWPIQGSQSSAQRSLEEVCLGRYESERKKIPMTALVEQAAKDAAVGTPKNLGKTFLQVGGQIPIKKHPQESKLMALQRVVLGLLQSNLITPLDFLNKWDSPKRKPTNLLQKLNKEIKRRDLAIMWVYGRKSGTNDSATVIEIDLLILASQSPLGTLYATLKHELAHKPLPISALSHPEQSKESYVRMNLERYLLDEIQAVLAEIAAGESLEAEGVGEAESFLGPLALALYRYRAQGNQISNEAGLSAIRELYDGVYIRLIVADLEKHWEELTQQD